MNTSLSRKLQDENQVKRGGKGFTGRKCVVYSPCSRKAYGKSGGQNVAGVQRVRVLVPGEAEDKH